MQTDPGGVEPRRADTGESRAAPRWGLGDVVLGVAMGFVLSGSLGSLALLLVAGDESNLAVSALSTVGLWLGLVGAVVLASRRKGTGTLAGDFGLALRWPDLGIGVASGIVAQVALLPLLALALRPLLGRPEVSGPARDLIEQATGPARLVLVLVVVIGAPVVEELFYRGMLLRSLQRRFAAIPAVVGSGVLFGLSHQSALPLRGLLLVWISLGALGAVLSTLAVRTGRLGSSIVAHATFNAFTVVYVLIG